MFNKYKFLPALTIAVAAIFLTACGNSDEPVATPAPGPSIADIIKPGYKLQVHEAVFPALPQATQQLLKDFPLQKIEEIHQYLSIQRWNRGGDISMRGGTDYEAAARDLDIPASTLNATDFYYKNGIQKKLDSSLRQLYKGNPHLFLDSYQVLEPAAATGLNTFNASLFLFKGNDSTEAIRVAQELIAALPAWIDGCKFPEIIFRDTVLQTTEKLKFGLMWKRNGDIRVMTGFPGSGLTKASENTGWSTQHWNNRKAVELPSFLYLAPKEISDDE